MPTNKWRKFKSYKPNLAPALLSPLEFCGFSEIRQLNTISPRDLQRESRKFAMKRGRQTLRICKLCNLSKKSAFPPACVPALERIRSRDRLKGGAVCELTIILKQHAKPKTKHDFGFVCWPCLPRQAYWVLKTIIEYSSFQGTLAPTYQAAFF